MERCPKCDAELPPVANYCHMCGTSLHADEVAPSLPQEGEPEPEAQPEPETEPQTEPAPTAWRVQPVPGPHMIAPAFMAGLAGGFLVGVPGINNCFCLWMTACGVLAVFFFHKQFGRTALPNEAARLGAMSGFFGFLVSAVVSTVSYGLLRRSAWGLVEQMREQMRNSTDMVKPEDAKRALEMIDSPGGAFILLITFGALALFAFLALATLGGLLAGAVTARRK